MHADVVGRINSEYIAGKRYFILLYEDSSAVSLVRFLRYKSEAGRAIKEMISDLETLRKGRVKQLVITEYDVERVKRLRTDKTKELMTKEFGKWLQERGIQHELTAAYSSESNGKAERINRTLFDMARTLLLDARHVPHHEQLWAEN